MEKYPPGFTPDDESKGQSSAALPPGVTLDSAPPLSEDEQSIQNYKKLQEQYGGIGQQALAGVEGAAKGFAGPIATGAERLLSKAGVPGLTPEDQEGRAQANPVTHGLTEFGGLAGGLATGTGEAALMEAAGHALAPAAATTLGKIGSAAVKGAVENAVFQGGDEISKMINQDPKQSVGSAIADVGLSAALGAGIGGAFSGASALWKKANGSAVAKGITDFTGRVAERVHNPDPAAALNEELQSFHDNISAGADEVYGQNGIKAKAIKEGMPEMNENISNQINKTNDMLSGALTKLKDDGNIGLLKDAAEKFQEKVTSPGASSADVFDATNELKQQLQEWGKFNKLAPPPLSERNFISTVKNLSFDVRNSLEDTSVWGKAGEAQKSINGAFSKFAPALKDFQSKFMEKVGGVYEISPSKIQTFENQLGKASAKTKQKMLQNFVDAAGEYRSVIDEAHGTVGLESPIKDTPMNAITRSLQDVTSGQKIADAVIDKLAGKLGGSAIGGAIGSLAGHAWLGALVGEHALPSFFKSAMPVLLKAFTEKEASAEGAKSAVQMTMAAIRGDNAATKAVRGLFSEASPELSHLIVDKRSRDKLMKQVADYQTDPEKYSQVGGATGHYMPNHDIALKETASNAVNYLQTIKPAIQKRAPLDPEIKPTAAQMAQYHRAVDIAQQPLTVLRLIKEGKLTPQDVQHLTALYPELHNGINQKIMDTMTDHVAKGKTVPYSIRLGLSQLMGQPLDSGMSQAGIASNQMAISQGRQQAQAQNAPMKPKKTNVKDMTLANRMAVRPKDDS